MNRYDKEFKQQAVQLILEQGKSVNQTAKELGVSNKTLYHWVRLYREDQDYAFPGSGKLKPDDQAIRDMKRRIRDLTYVPTKEGWLYVASVMDLFSRKIIGWHADKQMTKELVITALDRAYQRQQPPKGVLHHSDRGSQYASHDYQDRLKEYKMEPSMSRKGDCLDNAVNESFHGILKRELVHLSTFSTRKQAKLDEIFEYIECFYNRKRIHSTLGYLSPDQFERMYANTHLSVA